MAHLLSRLRTTHRGFSVSLTPSNSIVQSDLGFGKDCNCHLFMLTRDMFSIGTIGLIYLFSGIGYTEGKHRWGGVCWFERTARRSRTLSVGTKIRKSVVLVFIQSHNSAGVGLLDPLYIRLPSTHVYISPPSVRHFSVNAATVSAARHYCTSSSDSDEEGLADLAQSLTDNVQDLEEITNSLKAEKRLLEEHLTKSDRVCRILANQVLPDLKWVVKDAAKYRSKKNEGIDPAGQQAKSVLDTINATQKIIDLLDEPLEERDPSSLDALESTARAAELNNLLENRLIPAVGETLAAYQELKAATPEAMETDSPDTDSDSNDSDNSDGGADIEVDIDFE